MESIYTRRDSSGQLTRQQIGKQMEKLACDYLCQAGLRWLASNVFYRQGELDLIMLEGTIYVLSKCVTGRTTSMAMRRRQ